MAQPAVVTAFKTRVESNWTHCPVIDDDNTSAEKPATPYLAIQFPLASEEQITIGAPGNNMFRESGAARFVLVLTTGSGSDFAAAWLEELRSLLRGKQFDGVTTWAPSSPAYDDRNRIDVYYRLSFAVPYFFDFTA